MNTEKNEQQQEKDKQPKQRRPYEAPSIRSEPLFESVAAMCGKSALDFCAVPCDS